MKFNAASKIGALVAGVAMLSGGSWALGMEIEQHGTQLTVAGSNFRYVWDTRRGGELAEVDEPGLAAGGWWNKGTQKVQTSNWQRVNSTFAWKSLDTIPSLSFSIKRAAYYSGEWNVAYANADRKATLKIVKQAPDEVIFETHSNPHILENLRLPVPWQVTQRVHVFDSGVIVTRFEITLPKDETYELDWAMMSVNLDDSLYKEPHPDRQWKFAYGWAFPAGAGEAEMFSNFYKPVLQDLPHLPLDIDLKIEKSILTEKPMLFGSAAYDLTHVKGAAQNGFAEWCLEEARSLAGTKEDFGSFLMVRPQSGMSHVPTDVGSMRGDPCMSAGWNLFDGKTRGLNEEMTYRNTLTFAVGGRKHSSMPTTGTDDRNVLLGARIYYARDKMPAAGDVKAMAAEGCDTLILGKTWRAEASATAAVVKAAHDAGMRVAVTVDARDLRTLVTDTSWFTKVFQKDRDGLMLTNVSFLANAQAQEDFTVDGEPVSFKNDGAFRANAASFAVCMRKLREIVGAGGFLIGEDASPGPTLLSFAECDLHVPAKYDPYKANNIDGRTMLRNRCAAGLSPVVDSLTTEQGALAAMHGDTPIVLWPAKDQRHDAWWKLMAGLPKTVHIESDLLPAERHFTTSSDSVHGTFFDGGDGKGVLLLAAEKAGAAKVNFTLPGVTVTADGKSLEVSGGAFDAGEFAAWQIKAFKISAAKEAGK